MIVGVPRETYPGERRVALVPAVLANLAKAGMQVLVEAGAGAAAGYPDSDYADKGAKITLVMPKSAAEKAGVKVNDVVIAVGEKIIPDHEAMIDAIQRSRRRFRVENPPG